ncbi:MAG: hypothetical protein J6J42_01750 [Lachnospiraceae bacterium]|nr:hypothetical protein [Lachnospiraceae bacterium]MBP3609043.1 hypothetical protein [Lachnospiraceae bacterium]
MSKNKLKKCIIVMCCMVGILGVIGCGKSKPEDILESLNPDNIVPSKETLVAALTEADYEISEPEVPEVSTDTAERVLAEKGARFIDIVYGLTGDELQTVFQYYQETYSDYYIMAINGDYVYCVSDKKTFSKAGFTSTANIGIQYIFE